MLIVLLYIDVILIITFVRCVYHLYDCPNRNDNMLKVTIMVIVINLLSYHL